MQDGTVCLLYFIYHLESSQIKLKETSCKRLKGYISYDSFIHHSQNDKIIIMENRSVVRVEGGGLTINM